MTAAPAAPPASSTRSARQPARPARIRPPRRQAAAVRRPLGSLPFVLLVSGLLAGGLLALLLVNNSLAAGSFEQAQLKAHLTLLREQDQALRQEVQRWSSPTLLRAAAKKQGMVPAATTTYVDPLTGAILGTPLPAGTLPGTPPAGPSKPKPVSDAATAPASTSSDGVPRTTPNTPGRQRPGDGATTAPPAGDGATINDGTTAYDRAVVSGGDQ